MYAIAYCIDGAPRLAWPARIETERLDAEGNPTGEIRVMDNRQQIIDTLPPGIPYEIVEEADADVWWRTHLPPLTTEQIAARRKTEILAELNLLDAAAIRPLRSMVRGTATEADAARLDELDQRAEELRTELKEIQP